MRWRGRIGAAALALVGVSAAATSCATNGARTTSARDDPTVALASWGRQHADVFSTLSYDTGTVADYASTYDTAAMVGACQTVSNDVQGYRALPPVPDPVAAQHLDGALALFSRGTDDCISGSVNDDRALILRAVGELNRATSELQTTHSVLTAAASR